MCFNSVGLQHDMHISITNSVVGRWWVSEGEREREREWCVISCSVSQSISDHSVSSGIWTQIHCLRFQKYSRTKVAYRYHNFRWTGNCNSFLQSAWTYHMYKVTIVLRSITYNLRWHVPTVLSTYRYIFHSKRSYNIHRSTEQATCSSLLSYHQVLIRSIKKALTLQ
jgi:hypothetical protein